MQEYTSGEANTLVKSCLQRDLKQAYINAKKVLDEKYGNEYIIAQQYLQKLADWPQIKAEDRTAMHQFSLFLTSIENLMCKMTTLNQLNSRRDMKEILMKLPYNMRVKFRGIMADKIEKREKVEFNALVKFVTQQASHLKVPLFENISDRKPNVKVREKSNVKPKTFYTKEEKREEKFCQCCKKTNHYLNDCFFFNKKNYTEKQEFIKKKKLCYNCLKSTDHYAKDCNAKLSCKTCGKQHPSCLHRNADELQTKNNEKKAGETSKAERNINMMVKQNNKTICPSVPIILRSKTTKKFVQTYVALDNFSTASYMDQQLLRIWA